MIIRKEDVNAIDFNGISIRDYTSNCDEKSSFAVITVPPHVSHQISWSTRSDKYYYIIEGSIDFLINEKKHCLKEGDFCLIKKGEKFTYTNNSNEASSLILVHTPTFKIDKEIFQ
jgi:mannose-6-phosphate isomerase-like protein (cupin superfamily)